MKGWVLLIHYFILSILSDQNHALETTYGLTYPFRKIRAATVEILERSISKNRRMLPKRGKIKWLEGIVREEVGRSTSAICGSCSVAYHSTIESTYMWM